MKVVLTTMVIPAKAGIEGRHDVRRPLDPRFRGDDASLLGSQHPNHEGGAAR